MTDQLTATRHLGDLALATAGSTKWRADAAAAFSVKGVPTLRDEAWKFTNLRPLDKVLFDVTLADDAQAVDADSLPRFMQGAARLVFVNGWFDAAASTLPELPKGAMLKSLAQSLKDEDEVTLKHMGRIFADDNEARAFAHLNTAMAQDGVVLHLPRGAELSQPIELLFLSDIGETALTQSPRLLVVMEQGSRATLIEHHATLGEAKANQMVNIAAEIHVARDAYLSHFRLQNAHAGAFHFTNQTALVDTGAHYDSFTLTTGAGLSRNDIRVKFIGDHAEASLNGLYLIRGNQHCDTSSRITHAHEACASRQTYKGVIADRAHGVFQGKIEVTREAQKTDGYQLNRALLLSPHAEINAKPELEIFADDVKCSHGCTAGQLDDTGLFYIMQRGIPEKQARKLLIHAYMAEVLELIENEELREAATAHADAWLEGV